MKWVKHLSLQTEISYYRACDFLCPCTSWVNVYQFCFRTSTGVLFVWCVGILAPISTMWTYFHKLYAYFIKSKSWIWKPNEIERCGGGLHDSLKTNYVYVVDIVYSTMLYTLVCTLYSNGKNNNHSATCTRRPHIKIAIAVTLELAAVCPKPIECNVADTTVEVVVVTANAPESRVGERGRAMVWYNECCAQHIATSSRTKRRRRGPN